MILYESEYSIRDIRPFYRQFFVKAVLPNILHPTYSSELVMKLEY